MVAARILFGNVMHERLRPHRRRFVYPVFAVRLNLACLAQIGGPWFGIDRRRPLSIRTRDHGPRDGSSLDAWMRAILRAADLPADGEIWLQAFPRVFGRVFNPVCFWYCHDGAGRLRALLAEVNNTFGEHHAYLLTRPDGAPIGAGDRITCCKMLHVSPFCAVEGHYEFRLRDTADTSFAAIDYHDAAGLLLRTAIGGRLRPFTSASLLRALLRFPLHPFLVLGRIHWQALRLWLAGTPWQRKPEPPAQSLSYADQEEIRP
jgi:DUF1365 family protein